MATVYFTVNKVFKMKFFGFDSQEANWVGVWVCQSSETVFV